MDDEPRPRQKYLTEEGARALLAAAPAETPVGMRNLCMMALMLEGGLKVSELVGKEKDAAGRTIREVEGGLRIGSIDWKQGRVRVTKPRTGERRELALSADTLEMLARWLDRRPDSDTDLVFTTMTGGRLQNRYVRQFLSDYGERAGLGRGVKPSMLRHTFAGRMFRETGNLELLRELLGHADVSATARYAHTPPEDA
jgi:integrase/recombinase XerD